ncbi:MAG: hypothetical protein ABWU16_01470 [Halothiobacillaceae bacterium]
MLPGRDALIHLAHVTGWGHGELMAMPIRDLADWCEDAVRYWNRINGDRDAG